jgi:hypothetical protein
MKTVHFMCNWTTPEDMVNNFVRIHDVGFKNIKFIPTNNADYTVILNCANAPFKFENTFYFQCEPEPIRGCMTPAPKVQYDFSVSKHHNPIFIGYRCMKSASELMLPNEKSKEICAVLSSKGGYEGRVMRMEFAKNYLTKIPEFDLFGAINPKVGDVDKYAVLSKYKYTFNAENCPESNFFTEKLIDPIINESLCFYWGCPNVEQFIDPRCFIRVDISKPAEALEVVKQAMADNEWEKRIGFIREEKRKIIYEKQICIWLDNFIGSIQ